MTVATVGAGGVVIMPTAVLDALQMQEGDRIEFVLLGDGDCLLVLVNRSVTELRGMFGKPSKRVSIDGMNRAVARPGSGGEAQT
ncbi:AbrB/MazE/SpoVT family DNA-binding domain-containing protein [Roseateles sp. LKC17W]|uniref:AbrB/MazE/SpoVT family DNA-binding domain-containing protein n=1 Tax=Pelomonas margarita TaxID=3299031 RepID=A0ABW7FQG7_9BURK